MNKLLEREAGLLAPERPVSARARAAPVRFISTRSISDPKKGRGVVRDVVRTLVSTYGLPRHGNPRRPLDDLVYVILSNKTAPRMARRVYRELKRAYPSWGRINQNELRNLRLLLQPAGLGNIRSLQLAGIVSALKRAFGRATLAPLKSMSPPEAERFLAALPGVSVKVAKCVLMYTLGHRVLPVDSHVHRVSRRLGWTGRRRPDQSHEDLERIVPPEFRFAYHVCSVAHGRAICRPSNPNCGVCPIRGYCEFYRKRRTAR